MLIALMVLASANAQVVEKGPVTAQPVTVDVMTGRIEQHAQRVLTEYPPGAAVARSVQIDSAWPSSFGSMLVSRTAQGSHENRWLFLIKVRSLL